MQGSAIIFQSMLFINNQGTNGGAIQAQGSSMSVTQGVFLNNMYVVSFYIFTRLGDCWFAHTLYCD
jgi:predicted outer membrane repeat protein